MRQDWRDFIRRCETLFPQEVLCIENEIDSRYETTAIVKILEEQERYPLIRYRRIKGYDIPVVGNLLASRRRMALALATDEENLPQEYARKIADRIAPVVKAERAPFMDNYAAGDAVDVRKFPILTHFSIDKAPYITAGLVIAKDPATGVDTCGYHRLQLKGKDKFGVSLHSRKRMWHYLNEAQRRNRNLEAAIVLGVHPAITMGSMAITAPDVRKYEKIGGLLGEPLALAQCPNVDIQAPFWAEIVFEGEILAQEWEDEGPFGEFTDYACERSTRNIFQVKSVCHRNDVIYQSISGGMCAEHNLIMAVQREGDLLQALRESLPNVAAVHVPLSGCGFFHCYISLRQSAAGQAGQAILKALSIDHNLKLVVVVDDDIDVKDEQRIWWALATRMQADRDLIVIPQSLGMGCTLDPSSDEWSRSAKLGIDATKPLGEYPAMLNVEKGVKDKMERLLAGIYNRAGV